ncbi:MAG: CPBP family intramembrane glutamic endopeptidase [Phycisphaerae bacterium]
MSERDYSLSGFGEPFEDAADEPVAEESSAQTPNFCTRCGAPWQPDWDRCPHCSPPPPPPLPPQPDDPVGAVVPPVQAAPVTAPPPAGSPVARTLWVYFLFLASSGVMAIMIRADESAIVTAEFVGTFLYALVAFVAMAACWSTVRPALAETGRLRWYPIVIGLGILTFAGANVLVEAINSVMEAPEFTYSGDLLEAGYGWGMVLLLIAVGPAISEEIAFRGIIQPSLGHILKPGEALLVTALLFAILHLQWLGLLHLSIMGLVLGWVRIKSGSLYPCMLLHFVHNSLVVLQEWWVTQ